MILPNGRIGWKKGGETKTIASNSFTESKENHIKSNIIEVAIQPLLTSTGLSSRQDCQMAYFSNRKITIR
jgi:hypothetical protein